MLRHYQPDVVQGWMNHGNLAAALAVRFSGVPARLAWNVRQSLHDLDHEKRLTRLVMRINVLLSGLPDIILYNSSTSARQHEELGFPPDRRRLVPNGFDLNRFYPSQSRRLAMRRKLGVADDELLIGMVARFHSMKNHKGMFEAAALVARDHPNAKFLFVGEGMVRENPAIASLLPSGISSRLIFCGLRADLPDITRALDIAVNVSVHGEGFPNALGEAMACAVPCVVTDVGDSANIVGEGGLVCSSTDAISIAATIGALASEARHLRQQMGANALTRARREYSLPAIVAAYDAVYEGLLISGRELEPRIRSNSV